MTLLFCCVTMIDVEKVYKYICMEVYAMKRNYVEPEIGIIETCAEDIIASSFGEVFVPGEDLFGNE